MPIEKCEKCGFPLSILPKDKEIKLVCTNCGWSKPLNVTNKGANKMTERHLRWLRNALGNRGYFQLALHKVSEDSLEPNRRFIAEEHQHKRLDVLKDEGLYMLVMN